MTTNLFGDLPLDLPDELFTTLLDADGVRIERIVSYGHASPEDFWYDQDEHEWVIVLKGSARLRFEDRVIELMPGDFVNIPAHKKHRVEWTTRGEPTVWLAFFLKQRESVKCPLLNGSFPNISLVPRSITLSGLWRVPAAVRTRYG